MRTSGRVVCSLALPPVHLEEGSGDTPIHFSNFFADWQLFGTEKCIETLSPDPGFLSAKGWGNARQTYAHGVSALAITV